jgi:hypothetical protein
MSPNEKTAVSGGIVAGTLISLFLAWVIVESAAAKLYTQLGITNSAVNRAKDRAEAIEQQRKTDNELIWKVLLWERIQ